MIGVVLWSSRTDSKAVIWCEDHGDLAYYAAEGRSAMDGVSLESGDVVQFELSQSRNQRYAHNPRLLGEQEYPCLAQEVMDAGDRPAPRPSAPANADNVIPLAGCIARRNRMALTG